MRNSEQQTVLQPETIYVDLPFGFRFPLDILPEWAWVFLITTILIGLALFCAYKINSVFDKR